MNSNLDVEENTFICLDDSCMEESKVIRNVQEMFLHRSHTDVRCLKNIRNDIEENLISINQFMIEHDLNQQLAYVDEQQKAYQLESQQLDQRAFFEGIKMYKIIQNFSDLSNRFINTRRVITILISLMTKQQEQMELTGDLSFLKNIEDLPYISKGINEQFQKDKINIQEYIKNIRKIILPHGETYVGYYVNGLKQGQGEYYYANGNVYKGQWSNDKINGQGEFKFASGQRYVGNYLDNKGQGQGEYYYANGNVYKGLFSNNKKNGQGEFKFADGERYVGNYVDDKKQGQGEYYYTNGNVYKGLFSNNKINGQGEFKFASGDRYLGNCVDGKRQGYGEYQYANGNVCKGLWSNDKQI